jgi:outer membrane protein assembly factor BamB
MDPKNILLLGVKGAVIALRRDTGERLWERKLRDSISADFVSVTADETRVYAHTYGELFCLDLRTGNPLWHDKLSGLGYGIASLAVPGQVPIPAGTFEGKRHQDASVTSTASSSH